MCQQFPDSLIDQNPDMALKDRLKRARIARGLTQESLAEAAGCGQSIVGNLESGEQRSSKWIPNVAAALNVPAHWLTDDDYDGPDPLGKRSAAPSFRSADEVEETAPLRRSRAVPAVGDVKGGADGYLEELQYPPGHGDGVVYYPTADQNAYALRVRGDSMSPRYRQGQYIIVEPSIEPQPGDDVVVICKNGRKLLKVMAWIRGDSVSLLSVNDGHAPLTLDLSEVERMHTVAGTVPARALQKG